MNRPLASTLSITAWPDWPDPKLTSCLLWEPAAEIILMPILGPTATALIRRLSPVATSTYTIIQTAELARSLGVGVGLARTGILANAIARLDRFQLTTWADLAMLDGHFLVVKTAFTALPATYRRRLPSLARQVHLDLFGI
jgi:hypothetical protein